MDRRAISVSRLFRRPPPAPSGAIHHGRMIAVARAAVNHLSRHAGGAGARGHEEWHVEPPWAQAPLGMGRGTSSAGLRSKKPTGLSMKPIVRHGHHRPVLRAHHVVGAKGVPDHDVGVRRSARRPPTYAGRPAPPGAGSGSLRPRSVRAGRSGVTHRCLVMKAARFGHATPPGPRRAARSRRASACSRLAGRGG